MSSSVTARDPWQGWLTSLAFWACLFMAAALYAGVALSPKLLAYLALEREFEANQWRLVALDRQVSHLEKVIEAQTHDPAFVREQARSAFDITSPDEQQIPVDSHLRLSIEAAAPAANSPARSLPWYAPLLAAVARSRDAGSALLGVAAALVLYAFTFLNERRFALRASVPRSIVDFESSAAAASDKEERRERGEERDHLCSFCAHSRHTHPGTNVPGSHHVPDAPSPAAGRA